MTRKKQFIHPFENITGRHHATAPIKRSSARVLHCIEGGKAVSLEKMSQVLSLSEETLKIIFDALTKLAKVNNKTAQLLKKFKDMCDDAILCRIQAQIARAFFVSGYILWCRSHPEDTDLPRPDNTQAWPDVAPPGTNEKADDAAFDIVKEIQSLNDGKPLYDIYYAYKNWMPEFVNGLESLKDSLKMSTIERLTPEEFGWLLGFKIASDNNTFDAFYPDPGFHFPVKPFEFDSKPEFPI